jgi:hypothetical protein
MNKNALWFRWVIANALGELFGLGLTFAVGVLVISGFGDQTGIWIILLSFLVAVASGAIEATIVGLAQHWAMLPWFPTISLRSWWLGTLIGALIAYVLGYLPSTLMSIGEQASLVQTPMAEPPQWIVLLLAAGMGAVGGAVLSFAQWLAMRGKVRAAGWWVTANMLAWLFGMPIIFWGIDAAQKGQPLWQTILVLTATLFVAGAVVGAIHGMFLARMAGANFTDK